MIKNKRGVLRHTIVTAALCLVMGITGFADDKGTVVTASAKIRQSADASSEQIGSVTLGGNVDIIAQTTGTDGSTWYQVYVDANTKGYIRADLVKAEGSGTISKITNTTASTTTTTTASTSTDQSETQVTAVDSKKCTVSQNSVRIRKGASTNHDIVATANRGMALTITGEATGSDGKTWYQVTFTYNNSEITGFIRSDLVTFDDVSDDAATSQITGEGAEASTEEVETETETQTEETEAEENSSQGIVLMNVDETPYILPGFSLVSLSWNDESIQAYSNGGFYLFYARMENGDEGWYIFDSEKGEYQRYVYTASPTATVPSNTESIGIIPVIILIIIIVILAAVIGLLLIKLKDASNGYEYDDYQEDDNDTDDLEFEEIEPRRQPVPVQRQQQRQPQQYQQVRRTSQQPTQGTNQSTQARQNGQVRRPQGQTGQAQSVQGQQVRRTTQNPNGQQVRRPQGQSGQTQSVQGQQVRRTTQNPNGQQVRRSQAQRTANNNQSINASQQGYKAKTILEKQDDDMEFIDL
jgi:hypothetical protein